MRQMPITVATSLSEALSALGGTPARLVLAGGPTSSSRSTSGIATLDRDATVIAISRVPELRQWTLDRPARMLGSVPVSPMPRSPPSRSPASCGTGPGSARWGRRRSTTPPPSGQPRHLLAGGRWTPAAGRAPAVVEVQQRRRDTAAADRRVHGRCQAHRQAARRADHRGRGPAARWLAGLCQGRRTQRDGHAISVRASRPIARRVRCAWRSVRSARRSSGRPLPSASPCGDRLGPRHDRGRRRRPPRQQR